MQIQFKKKSSSLKKTYLNEKIIPYGKQYIKKSDLESVTDALKQDKITTGPLVKKFEKNLYLYKVKSCSCLQQRHLSFYLAFLATNLKKDDIVIMPSITFVSSYSMATDIKCKIIPC